MKENTNDRSNKLRELLVEEINKVVDTSTGLLKEEVSEFVDCPLCGSKEFRKFWSKDGFTYVKCQDCEFVYLNPRLNESATRAFGNGAWTNCYNKNAFYPSNDSTDLKSKLNYRNLMEIARIVKRGNLLEIGCATGYFLQAARDDFGFDVFGVELDEESSQFAREKRGLDVRTTILEEAGFPENMFDVVYMRVVLEHIRKPRDLLQEIHRIMRRGGLIVIEVPNVDGLIYKFVGEREVCVFGFEHVNFFSDKTLTSVLKKTGFETIEIKMESLGFTLPSLINYFWGRPAFTTVSSPSGPSRHRSYKVSGAISSASNFLFPINWILPKFANALKKGSVIIVYAVNR